MTGAQPEYQYHLKDHLGNVRLTFTTKDEIVSDTATLETANAAEEQSKFLYYDEAVKINYDKFDYTNEGGTYYATRLTGGSTNEKYRLTKTLSVMPGDKISMEVYAKYLDPNSNNRNTALTNFIGSITGGTAPAGTFVDGGSAGSIGGGTYPITGINHTSETGTAPKAYLNYIVFNKDMTTVLDMGFKRITTNSREYGQDAAHDKLAFEGSEEVLIKEPGYVYIYLSNENATPVEVFFDDFSVVHKKSPVVQMDDYYPFGLSFNSYSRENSTQQNYLFNSGSELERSLDLGWYQTLFRTYDPAIGRFMQIDPLADFFSGINPYSFAFDNPVLYSDPDGLAPMWWLKFRANVKQAVYNVTGRGNQHAIIHGRNKGQVVEVGARTANRTMHKPTPSPSNNTPGPIDDEPSLDLSTRVPKFPVDIPDPQIPDQVPDPRPDPVPDPIPTFRDKQIPPGSKINFNERIPFNISTDRLSNPGALKSQLDDLVKLLANNTGMSVYIAGNVSLAGIQGNSPAALNQNVIMNDARTSARNLMNARAKAIYDFLVGQGVNPQQMTYGTGNVRSNINSVSVSFEIRNK